MINCIHASRFLVSFAALLATTVAACGGSSGPPDKLSQAFEDGLHRNCDKAFDCKSSYLPAMHSNRTFEDFAGGMTADACFNSLRTITLAVNGQDFFTKLDASVTAGRIKYNANDYETCFKAFEALTCDQFFRQNGATAMEPAACDAAQAGQVATGGACTIDDDCATVGDDCDATAHTCMQ